MFNTTTLATTPIALVLQQATAAATLCGTTSAGSTPSTLYIISPVNGSPTATVGPVGYTVNVLSGTPFQTDPVVINPRSGAV
jgi:hypothetical protein